MLGIIYFMEKWSYSRTYEYPLGHTRKRDIQTERIPDVLISAQIYFTRAGKRWQLSPIHTAPLRFDRFENMRNYKH